MKATELMIGDWVQESNHRQKGKVTYLDANRDCSRIDIQPVDGGGYPCANDVIFPIPLTAKILEKNGWMFIEGCDYSTFPVPSKWTYQFVPFALRVNGEIYSIANTFTIKYVHELQHALRLCGLDELADNFKV